MLCWLVLGKHQSLSLESCSICHLFGVHEISEPNKVRRLVRESNKAPGVLYEWAASTEEIKVTLRGGVDICFLFTQSVIWLVV